MSAQTQTPWDVALDCINAAPAEYVAAVNVAARAVADADDAVDRADRIDDFSNAAGIAFNAAPEAMRRAYVAAYNAASDYPVNVFSDLLERGKFPAAEVAK